MQVDDGTGLLSCCFWKSDAWYSGVDVTAIKLASLLVVGGKLSVYRGEMQMRPSFACLASQFPSFLNVPRSCHESQHGGLLLAGDAGATMHHSPRGVPFQVDRCCAVVWSERFGPGAHISSTMTEPRKRQSMPATLSTESASVEPDVPFQSWLSTVPEGKISILRLAPLCDGTAAMSSIVLRNESLFPLKVYSFVLQRRLTPPGRCIVLFWQPACLHASADRHGS